MSVTSERLRFRLAGDRVRVSDLDIEALLAERDCLLSALEAFVATEYRATHGGPVARCRALTMARASITKARGDK